MGESPGDDGDEGRGSDHTTRGHTVAPPPWKEANQGVGLDGGQVRVKNYFSAQKKRKWALVEFDFFPGEAVGEDFIFRSEV